MYKKDRRKVRDPKQVRQGQDTGGEERGVMKEGKVELTVSEPLLLDAD